jgi:predicted transport protein
MEVFLYALRAPETRRQYPRRLKVFFDYVKLEGPIEQQAREFLAKAKQNLQWAQNSLMQFITFQKERAKNGEISYLTIGNYYKATKLFVEMNTDTPIINWKKIARGIPILHSLKREQIDWSQSRVIFIAPEFTKYQQQVIGFKDVGIQLWEVHKYNNGLLVFNEVKSPSTKEPITTIAKDSDVVKKVTEEIKVYTEEDHLASVDDKIKELYSELKSAILSLGKDIEVRAKKLYVAFRRKQTFVSIIFLKSKLKAYLNVEINQIDDPLKKARDVKDIGHYSSGKTEIIIADRGELSYVLSLIKQAYERS